MTGFTYGDGVSRTEELEAEFEAYRTEEGLEDREIGDHRVTVTVETDGVRRYRCRRCGMIRTMTVLDFETSPCEPDGAEEQLVTDGGTVEAETESTTIPREDIRRHVVNHPDTTLSGIIAGVGMSPNDHREQVAFYADLVRGQHGIEPQPTPRPRLTAGMTAVCDECSSATDDLVPHGATAERAETWVCHDCLSSAMARMEGEA